MEIWIIAAILGLAIFAAGNIFDKIFRENYIKSTPAFLILFIGKNSIFLLLIPFVDFSIFSATDYLLLIISTILWILIVVPYSAALSFEEVSRVVPVWNLAPIFVLIISAIFLNERLVATDYVAIALLIAGGIIISTHFEDIKRIKLSKAFWFMLASCIAFSLYLLVIKELYTNNEFWSTFIVSTIMGGIFGLSLLIVRSYRNETMESAKSFKKKGTILFVIAALFSFAGAIIYDYSIQIGSPTIIAALDGFQSLFLFIYAIFLAFILPGLIKEDTSRTAIITKILGLTIMGAGLLLLN